METIDQLDTGKQSISVDTAKPARNNSVSRRSMKVPKSNTIELDQIVQDEKVTYRPLQFKMSDAELLNNKDFGQLQNQDCAPEYKNRFEVAEKRDLTRFNLSALFKMQLEDFPTYSPKTDSRTVSIQERDVPYSLKVGTESILVRMKFSDKADKVDLFLKAVLDPNLRQAWDTNLEEL